MRIIIAALLISFLGVGIVSGQEEISPDQGFIVGKVVYPVKGMKIKRAVISIFNAATGPPPDEGAVQRVPDGLIVVRGTDVFRIMLPAGHYYLGVMYREDLQKKGPPGEGEKYFFPRDDNGKLRQFEVVAGQSNEIGELSGSEPEETPEIPNALVAEGTVKDEQGKPFVGALILVRSDLMTPRPLFVSKRTGADGKYQLKLPPGGPYYLVARENLVNVGRPKPGDFVGTYGGNPPQAAGKAPSVFSGGIPLSGGANQVLTGLDITMYKIPDPEEVKKRILEESENALIKPAS